MQAWNQLHWTNSFSVLGLELGLRCFYAKTYVYIFISRIPE